MDVNLTVELGRPIGSRAAARLRAEGRIPGVVYGLGSDPVSVTVPWPDLRKALSTEAGLNALVTLDIEGDAKLSVVKELQRDPVRRSVNHVDFLLIDRDAPLEVDVPLVLVGSTAKLETAKGMIDQLLYTLPIKAKPGFIPTALEADISEVEIGTQVRVGDIALPDGVTCELDADVPVAQGSATRSTLALEGEGEGGEGGEGAEGAEGEPGGTGDAGGGADDSSGA